MIHFSASPRLCAVTRAFLTWNAAPSHAAALLGGFGLGYQFASGASIYSLWIAGILIVYVTWFVYSLLSSDREGNTSLDVVRADGLSYLPLTLLPLLDRLDISWMTLSTNHDAAVAFSVSLTILCKAFHLKRDLTDRAVLSFLRTENLWAWMTVLCGALYAAFFSVISYQQFASLVGHTSFFDLAHYDQAAWNTIHGRILECTYSDGHMAIQMNRLGLHVDPILVLFALFYAFYSSPVTLLVLQSVVLALATWPLYLLTRRLTQNSFVAFCVCVSFLLHPGIQYGNIAQFHAVCAAPLCLFALIYAWEIRNLRAFWVAFALTLACKENLALTTFAVGLWLLFRKGKGIGSAVCVVSVVWFIICEEWIIPHYLGKSQTLYLDTFYKTAGGSLMNIALRLLTDPVASLRHMFTISKLSYLDALLCYVGYVPFFAPLVCILAIPELMINLLSDNPHMHSLQEHYNFVTIPVLIVATVYALAGIQKRVMVWRRVKGVRLNNLSVALGIFLLLQAATANRACGVFPWYMSPKEVISWKLPRHTETARRIMRRIGPQASVAASSILLSHLSQRRELYMLPYVGKADFVISDIADPTGQWRPDEAERDALSRVHPDPNYRLIAAADGIFLWQRNPYVRPDRFLATFDFRSGFALLAQPEVLRDPAVATGIQALKQQRNIGVRLMRTGDINAKGRVLREPSLILTTLSDTYPQVHPALATRYWSRVSEVTSREGYLLRSRTLDGHPCLVVMSPSHLGLAYALHYVADTLRGNPSALHQTWDAVRNPALRLRLMSTMWSPDPYYDDPATALKYGFNAVMIPDWPSLVTYSRFDQRIYGGRKNEHHLRWVQHQQHRARALITRAKSLHLKVVTKGDLFLFPKSLFKLYGAELGHQETDSVASFTVCAGQKLPWQLVEVAMDELFATFPEIDYVMIRTGENYPLRHLIGSGPSSGECHLCHDLSYVQTLCKTINTVRERVVDIHHRQYIHRAWDLGHGGFHANPQVYNAVVKGLKGSRGLIISLKHTETDFWRYNRLNPNIGTGNVAQMLEFQCAREFEGKGAYPNYLGALFAYGSPETRPQRGLLYAYSVGVQSGWAWAKGGGRGGPFLKTDLWVDANVDAIARLMWDPFLTPRQMAREWAMSHFGEKAGSVVTDILLESQEACAYSAYFSPYTRKTSAWLPALGWTRDDIIRGMRPLAAIYAKCSSPPDFNTVIREQHEAVQLVESSLLRFRKVMPYVPDPTVAEQAYQSLLYRQSLYRVRMNYVCGTFYYLKWCDSLAKDEVARTLALSYLNRWKEEWHRYCTEIPRLRWAASLYISAGMVKDCEHALRVLRRPPREGVNLNNMFHTTQRWEQCTSIAKLS